MKPWKKYLMAVWGLVVGALVMAQMVMGRAILTGGAASMKKMHEHTGYLTTLLGLGYVLCSVLAILYLPEPTSETNSRARAGSP